MAELVDEELRHGPEDEPDARDRENERKGEADAEAANTEMAHGGIIGQSGRNLTAAGRGPSLVTSALGLVTLALGRAHPPVHDHLPRLHHPADPRDHGLDVGERIPHDRDDVRHVAGGQGP